MRSNRDSKVGGNLMFSTTLIRALYLRGEGGGGMKGRVEGVSRS